MLTCYCCEAAGILCVSAGRSKPLSFRTQYWNWTPLSWTECLFTFEEVSFEPPTVRNDLWRKDDAHQSPTPFSVQVKSLSSTNLYCVPDRPKIKQIYCTQWRLTVLVQMAGIQEKRAVNFRYKMSLRGICFLEYKIFFYSKVSNWTLLSGNFHCFTVHFDSLSFIHTNSCTFSYKYVSVF